MAVHVLGDTLFVLETKHTSYSFCVDSPKFRSLKHKIIQQSLENAGNFLSIFCILCMALYGFV